MKNFLIGIIFIVVGVAIFGLGINLYKKAKASETWPTVDGVVFSSEVSSYKDSKKNTRYSANVNYSYMIENKEYTSNDISMSEVTSSNVSSAEKICKQYPEGTKVKVFYNPENPDESLLIPGTSFVVYLPMIAGAIFLLIGIVLVGKPIVKIIFVFFVSR